MATQLRSPHRPAPTCSLCLHSYTTHDYTKHGWVAKPCSQHMGGTGEASGKKRLQKNSKIQLLFYDQLNKDEVYSNTNYNKHKEKMRKCLMKLGARSVLTCIYPRSLVSTGVPLH